MLTFLAANNGNTGSELPPHIVEAAAAQREAGELFFVILFFYKRGF
jgi:hypothetical protein